MTGTHAQIDYDFVPPCEVCSGTLLHGCAVYVTGEGEYMHAECCGPGREKFFNDDERALEPGEPIPRPFIWDAHERTTTGEVSDAVNDDLSVYRFGLAMRTKLAKDREKGRSGWDDPEKCSIEKLSAMLIEHVVKGDPVDVANFAMMIHQRGGRIIAPVALIVPELSGEQMETLKKLRGGGVAHLAADETFQERMTDASPAHSVSREF